MVGIKCTRPFLRASVGGKEGGREGEIEGALVGIWLWGEVIKLAKDPARQRKKRFGREGNGSVPLRVFPKHESDVVLITLVHKPNKPVRLTILHPKTSHDDSLN